MTTNIAQLKSLLSDHRFDRPTRLLRLQGWRDSELIGARMAGNAHRLAPATCSALAIGVAVTGSVALAVATAATAVAGALAPNHPIETIYNWLAKHTGRAPIPTNRAGKRLGCAIGALLFTGAAVALATGSSALGLSMVSVMGAVAAFVAITNICVPSIIFTLLWGQQRASAPTLVRGP